MLKNISEININKSLNESKLTFVNESKKAQNIKVVFLSASAEKITKSSNSMFGFKKACEDSGLEFLVIDPSISTILKNQDDTFTVLEGDNQYTISPKDTIIVPRRTVLKNSESKNFMYLLQGYGFFCFNTMDALEACEDKYVTARKLKQFGVPTPKTAIISKDSIDKLESKVEEAGGKFPIVCKILNGTQGIGVFIIESMMSLKSTLQTMFKLSPKSDILLQEMIDSDCDMRIHVIFDGFDKYSNDNSNFRVIGCMQRNKLEGDFRSNYSLGSTAEKGYITDEQKQIAINACKATGCRWAGVDLIIDKHTKDAYVIEVNSSPGTKGITTAAGDDVIGIIFDMFKEFKYTKNDNSVVGQYEYGKIKDFDKETTIMFNPTVSTSKLLCSSVKIDEKNEEVTFVYDGDTCNTKLVGVNGKDALVELNISFNGTIYKNVLVQLTKLDKDEKALLIVGSKFMSRLGNNVSVSSTQSWILTDNNLNFEVEE